MTMNDVLEEAGPAINLLLEGIHTRIKSLKEGHSSNVIIDGIAFEVLCALHERMTKDQIRQVLDTRIHD